MSKQNIFQKYLKDKQKDKKTNSNAPPSSRMPKKKNIYQQQRSIDIDDYHENFIYNHKQDQEEDKSAQNLQNSQNIAPSDLFGQETRLEQQCILCQQTNFSQGKVTLQCRHTLCNDCFKYWAAVSSKCPLCNRYSQKATVDLGGSKRKKQISRETHVPYCQSCGQNSHFHLMYFCDRCERKCIHTYCHSSLGKQRKNQQWFCQGCQHRDQQEFYQGSYRQYGNQDEESYEQYRYEDEYQYQDGFVVPDSQSIDYDYMDSLSTPKKPQKVNQKKKGKEEKKVKEPKKNGKDGKKGEKKGADIHKRKRS